MKPSRGGGSSRVVREAIQNAASIAGTAMTMGALVSEVPEKNPPAMPSPDMGGGIWACSLAHYYKDCRIRP